MCKSHLVELAVIFAGISGLKFVMALIAALAILAIGSTSTMAMVHHDHHSDSTSSDRGSSDSQPNCGFAQTVGSDGLCHYSVPGAVNACEQHLPECLTLGKLVLGAL